MDGVPAVGSSSRQPDRRTHSCARERNRTLQPTWCRTACWR